MLVLWAVFAFGLLLQSAAPHLRIAHNSFVIPSELTARGAINPAAIIARDRIVQSLSAILTFSGALGLALCHIRRQRRALRATQFAGNPSR
ncbi:MAG TPA: hypothetical protein VFA04_19130 [Bryobacteraceae bacterium]|nr:hypothetical protein [Bryobacteraceae bacterium]